ncbi:hypothetical protein SADUNF_Sadunf18G0047300 [Salix dunnii]|uniref:Uncharacterized protein n=1 Tax=Salix dunnii TaxID=1413687 RepID=A0A835J3Y9_9ROSI|nr:hypothetical protein SADUNF_Sadunf18G0047300 [Salix dunnii]
MYVYVRKYLMGAFCEVIVERERDTRLYCCCAHHTNMALLILTVKTKPHFSCSGLRLRSGSWLVDLPSKHFNKTTVYRSITVTGDVRLITLLGRYKFVRIYFSFYKEEEQIIKAVTNLGPIAMPIIARIKPVDLIATKNVCVSAVHFATSPGRSCPPFGDELKISAQEQVEYMLGEDEDMPLVMADDEVKSVNLSPFEKQLSSLLLESDLTSETAEDNILQCVSDLEWMGNLLSKMELMKDFVSNWAEISGNQWKLVNVASLLNQQTSHNQTDTSPAIIPFRVSRKPALSVENHCRHRHQFEKIWLADFSNSLLRSFKIER